MGKNARLDDAFSKVFLTESKQRPSRRLITVLPGSTKITQGEKGKAKKIKINEKPKDVGHYHAHKPRNFDFCSCLSKKVVNQDASGKKVMLSRSKIINTFLELLWPISSLKISRCPKMRF